MSATFGTDEPPKVAGVLLAAGSSVRFGAANKLLADLRGKPLVRHTAEALAAGGLSELVVVTGPAEDEIRAALAGIEARFVANPDHLEGMGGSVARGIGALAGCKVAGALVSPGDMPSLTAALVRQLVAVFQQAGGTSVVFPVTGSGEQRNPVVWPRRLFPALMTLRGAQGAKPLLSKEGPERIVTVPAADALFEDVDTQAELDKVRGQFARDA